MNSFFNFTSHESIFVYHALVVNIISFASYNKESCQILERLIALNPTMLGSRRFFNMVP